MDQTQLSTELLSTPLSSQWIDFGIRPHHGIVVPLFSLHSANSAGIGEFPDLIPLLTWMQTVGLDILQLLPLNDTGPESSPYSAISSVALNPIHLGLSSLPHIQECSRLIGMIKELQALTKGPRVEYAKINPMRHRILKEYYEEWGYKITESEPFQKFVKENEWLPGFALFKALKNYTQWQSWNCWPENIKNPSSKILASLTTKFESDITFHSLLQFLCFQQLQEVKSKANDLGISIQGDIPILIDRESADVWLHRDLFDLNATAGAPPDPYSAAGQNWGFPLYNWTELKANEYSWWKERLKIASKFYHLYRIDHIVGFFRIWAIPLEKSALEGSYRPDDPLKALDQGKELLHMMIATTHMLPIGEDLGNIPPEVRIEMKNLGICGTKVMRWERHWNNDQSFIPPNDYEPLSVTTVSTHDSSTLSAWWIENSAEARDYAAAQGWTYKVPLSQEHLFSILYASHHTSSLLHINLLQEYLALIPEFVSSDAENERINQPGIVSDLNWSYRFRPSIEQLTKDSRLDKIFHDLLPVLSTSIYTKNSDE